jgi:predicted HicB family RNase H-like nuclease
MLNYKGYIGQMEVDAETGFIFGRILDIRDVVTFKGEAVAEAKQAFQDSVDDYLDFCLNLDQSPDKPSLANSPFAQHQSATANCS